MELLETAKSIRKYIADKPDDFQAYQDYFSLLRSIGGEDKPASYEHNRWLRAQCIDRISKTSDIKELKKFDELCKKTYLYSARDVFEDYMIYIEWNRLPKDKFYLPRRRIMSRVAQALQKLVDDELDELFLSMPPRVGKTTMLLFFITWIIGRDSEKSNLYSAYSDTITSAFYNGCLELINDNVTYLWHDVFPASQIVATNSKDETFNVDRKKRYPSLTCRSLYGTLNGACDCNGMLISDDLIGGIEEALNKDRLTAAWSKVDNNLMPRAKEKAKILWCGTRWSMIDPIGLRMDLLLNEEKYKNRRVEIINLPALNENEESNFYYDFDVGFSTQYYLQRRASFERNNDMASWFAQYMGEPIERAGALFEPQDMKYYNGELPNEEPIRIFMPVDPAFGGGDFVSAPVIYKYQSGCYVHDVVYNNGDKNITQPLLAKKAKEHKVQAMRIEANKTTESYKEGVEECLKKEGYKLPITTKAAPNDKAKEIRIYDKAPEIREFYFLEEGKRSKEYSMFMQNLFSFKITGKNKNDDAPDSLSIGVDMNNYGDGAKIELGQRFW
jgi:predicted phage terminase large subunit-like protein